MITTTSQKRSISFLICALTALAITSCSDAVQPEPAPTIRLDSALPKVSLQGKEFTVFGSFSSVNPKDYRVSIEGFPCTIRAVSQSKMLVLPHPNVLGAGYLTVAATVTPDQPVRLSQRLYIFNTGPPYDTTTVDSIYCADPLLKVTNPSNAYYIQDLSLEVSGIDLPVDSFVVTIGPLTISTVVKANSLIKTSRGLTIPAGHLDLPDGRYPVVVSIPTQDRYASGSYVTISPLSIAGPTGQIYPGDTLTFDRYYPDLYAVVNNVRYSEGDPVRGLWRDGSSERMRVGPLASLAEGLTKIDFVSVKTGRVVAKSSINSSQQRTEDLQWSPQQQYAGRTIEITYPSMSSRFELKDCKIGAAWSEVLSVAPTRAIVRLGPNVKQVGNVTLRFADSLEKSELTITSRDRFEPLLRGTPPVPTGRLHMRVDVPGLWARVGANSDTSSWVETLEMDLLYQCAGMWCDTNLTSTFIPYASGYQSQNETDSAFGEVQFGALTGETVGLNGTHFNRKQSNPGNTQFESTTSFTIELGDLGKPVSLGNKKSTITLVGDEAFRTIRSLTYHYHSLTRTSGGSRESWLKLINLEPSLASQCAITLTFTQ